MYFNRFLGLLIILITVSFLFDSKSTEDQTTVAYPKTTVVNTVPLEEEEKYYKDGMFLASKLATTARLANHIFELVSIYGISRKLHRNPQIYILDQKYEKLIEGIEKVMPGLVAKFEIIRKGVPNNAKYIEFNKKCCVYQDLGVLRDQNSSILYLNGHFYQSYKYFGEYRKDILGMVAEKKEFGKLPTDGKILCIHVRRGDFVDGQHHSTNTNFTRSAHNFIVQQENLQKETLKTVIMGDDIKYESLLFPNSSNIFISSNSPSDDLIYSKYNCDISLITAPSSTFGWWISYFSKNQKVYYQDIRLTNDVNYKKGELEPMDFYPPKWVPITYSETGQIVITNNQ